ncbi:MAG: competence/damage-inducible protein A [Paludibacteraceae bacterium]|nr:competence/damage-inducible protein A [Paludibacteraceae bacterium]
MNVSIINIGDELLIGQVVNTNASWMASCLNENGMRVAHVFTIADNADEITRTLRLALVSSDAVLITGGLGPTKDDITKHTLCRFFSSHLVMHEPSLDNVRQIFAKRNYPMTPLNEAQAMVPAACTALLNKWGTAPGMWFEYEGKTIVSLPGVPAEMQGLMREEVVPRLRESFALEHIYHKNVWTFGIGESFLSDKIESWELALPENIHLAYLPQDGMVRLRLSAYGNRLDELEKQVDTEVEKLKSIVGEYIFGYDDDTLESVVGTLFSKHGKTLATAESCTGGNIARLITSVSGASAYYMGGVVAYANNAKEQLLGVQHTTLEQYGAVSRQTAEEMAIGAKCRFGTDYAVATTGIAGPTGGTPDKPVGTVWIAVADEYGVEARCFSFGADRARTVQRASYQALRWLQIKLE